MTRPAFRVTWETYTLESVGEGDAAARGFYTPDGYRESVRVALAKPGFDSYNMGLRTALDLLTDSPGDLESIDANDSDIGAARWFDLHFRTYADGITGETIALHIPENASPASRRRLFALLNS